MVKAIGVAGLFLVIAMSGTAFGQTAIGKITGSQIIDQDVSIDLPAGDPAGSAGIEAGSGVKVSLDPGSPNSVVNITVNAPSGSASSPHHGIYAQNGGRVQLGKVVIESTGQSVNITNGIFVSGSGSQVTLGDGVEVRMGNGGFGLLTHDGAQAIIGDDAHLESSAYTNGGGTVSTSTGNSSSITIGNRATIINDGRIMNNNNGSNHAVHALGGSVIEIGDDATITTFDGGGGKNHAVVAGLDFQGQTGQIEIGQRAVIEAEGDTSSAVLATLSGSLVKVGEGAEITVMAANDGTAVNAWYGGRVEIGSNSLVTAQGDGSTGLYAYSRYADYPLYTQKSTVMTGDGVQVTTTGPNAKAVIAHSTVSGGLYGLGADIVMGDDNIVTTQDNSSEALLAQGPDTSITTGANLSVTTEGEDSYGAYALGSTESGHGGGTRIDIGLDAKILTKGAYAYGLVTMNPGAVINAGSGLDVETQGTDAAAVAAWDAGTINLSGGRLAVDVTKTSAAVLASGEQGQQAKVEGRGVFEIIGNLVAEDYGTLDFELYDNSTLTGAASRAAVESYNNLILRGSNTTWQVTGDSDLSALTLYDSVVDLSSAPSATTLAVEKLDGQGRFILKTDLEASNGDLLKVTGEAHGLHTLTIQNSGSAAVSGSETLTVVTAAAGDARFILDAPVELGAWEYDMSSLDQTGATSWQIGATGLIPSPEEAPLPRENNAWRLRNTGRLTTTASAGINIFSGSYLLAEAENRSLIKRMGELRYGGQNLGFWARGFGGKFEVESGRYTRPYDLKYKGFQAGLDRAWQLESSQGRDLGRLYGGAALAYAKGDQEYDHHGSGSVDLKGLSLYATWMAPKGFYLDLVGQSTWLDNDFKVLDTRGQRVKAGGISTHGLGFSLEAGRKFSLWGDEKRLLYVEPQIQYAYSRQNGGAFRASNGLRLDVSSFDSSRLRTGARLGFGSGGPENRFDLYAKISHQNEFDGKVKIRANRASLDENFGSDRWLYGLGLNVNLRRQHSLFFDLERSSGGEIKEPINLTGGFRLTF